MADDVPPFIAVVGDDYDPTCRRSIVVEREVVIRDIPDLPTAVALFMGVIFSVDLSYPSKLIYEFLQKVILGMRGSNKMSSRMQTLVNKLSV